MFLPKYEIALHLDNTRNLCSRLTAIIPNQSQLMGIAAINRMHALVSLIQFATIFAET